MQLDVKTSCEAKRMARIMRSGSSLKVAAGSCGVRMRPSCKSCIPLNRSMSCPVPFLIQGNGQALMGEIAAQLIVLQGAGFDVGLRLCCW